MNKKQLILLIIVGAVIGGMGIISYIKRNDEWRKKGQVSQKLFADFPLNDVTQITIKQAQATLNLVKTDDLWRVRERGDFPANFNEISGFLRKMWEMKSGQSVEVGPSKLGVLELLPPDKTGSTGTLVEFKNKDGKVLSSLLLGKKTMKKAPGNASPFGGAGEWPDGRFVMVGSDIKSVTQLNDALANIEPKSETWLDKEFIKVEKVRSVQVDSATNAASSWKISKESETNEWNLANVQAGEQPDSGKLSSASTALANPTFNDVALASAKPEETGLDKPSVVTVETFDGFSYTLKVGKKTAEDNYYLALAVSANLKKERDAVKDEKPEDKAKLDKAFQDNLKKLQEKLDKEKKFEKYTYLVSKWTLDSLLKDRKELMVEKKEEKKDEAKPDGV